jgi:hypothetical protein
VKGGNKKGKKAQRFLMILKLIAHWHGSGFPFPELF